MLGDVFEETHQALPETQPSILGRYGDRRDVSVPILSAPLRLAQNCTKIKLN